MLSILASILPLADFGYYGGGGLGLILIIVLIVVLVRR